MDWTILAVPIGATVRNLAGWLENALKDGKVSKYEWGQLGSTILKVGVLSVGAILGLGMDPVSATGVGVMADFGINALKKAGSK